MPSYVRKSTNPDPCPCRDNARALPEPTQPLTHQVSCTAHLRFHGRSTIVQRSVNDRSTIGQRSVNEEAAAAVLVIIFHYIASAARRNAQRLVNDWSTMGQRSRTEAGCQLNAGQQQSTISHRSVNRWSTMQRVCILCTFANQRTPCCSRLWMVL